MTAEVRLGHSAMSAQCQVCPKADTTERFMSKCLLLTSAGDAAAIAGAQYYGTLYEAKVPNKHLPERKTLAEPFPVASLCQQAWKLAVDKPLRHGLIWAR